ncbi:MAG: S8 family serine peptidase [Bdellovibrionales bacterium]|nr:S8 family serine peptidase [Bdellovibrionales bacterium]MBK9041420.1 S8 family serine peptidase [Bdellovibrionales bacterium]
MVYFSARIIIFFMLVLSEVALSQNPQYPVFHSSFSSSRFHNFSKTLFAESTLVAKSICNGDNLPLSYVEVSRYQEDEKSGLVETAYYNAEKGILLDVKVLASGFDPSIEMQDLKSHDLKYSKFFLKKESCELYKLETQIGGERTEDLDNSFRIAPYPSSPTHASQVVIAVVDGGSFYLDHPIFKGKWQRTADGNLASPSTPFSYSKKEFFLSAHASWVTDIILKQATEVSILPIKTFSPDIIGFFLPKESLYASEGGKQFLKLLAEKQYSDIDYARKHGASIINMSFGIFEAFQGFRASNGKPIHRTKVSPPGSLDGYKQAMIEMKELVFVVIAHNQGVNLDEEKTFWLKQPRDNVIVVGAVDENGQLWENSNTGQLVDFAALGAGVESIALGIQDELGAYKYVEGAKALIDGTSFATPYVSRVIAKILQIRPDFADKPKQIKEFLCANVVKHPSLTQTTRCGGYISEDKILTLLSQQNR